MSDRLIKFGSHPTGHPQRPDLAGAAQWENEGGARPDPSIATAALASVPSEIPAPSKAVAIALDARQDRIMEIVSSDGRPPPRPHRMLEWRWVGWGAVLITVAIGAWILIAGVGLGAIGTGLAMGVLLLVGATPVLAAGLLRGKEETEARRIARIEQGGSRDP